MAPPVFLLVLVSSAVIMKKLFFLALLLVAALATARNFRYHAPFPSVSSHPPQTVRLTTLSSLGWSAPPVFLMVDGQQFDNIAMAHQELSEFIHGVAVFAQSPRMYTQE